VKARARSLTKSFGVFNYKRMTRKRISLQGNDLPEWNKGWMHSLSWNSKSVKQLLCYIYVKICDEIGAKLASEMADILKSAKDEDFGCSD